MIIDCTQPEAERSLMWKTGYHQLCMQLHDKDLISTKTLLREMGLDYDKEVEFLRKVKKELNDD